MKFGGAILATAIGVAILAASAGTIVAIADIPDQNSGAISDVAPITANAEGETPTATLTPSASPQDDHRGTVMVTPATPREIGDDKGGGSSGGGSSGGGLSGGSSGSG
ncbi:MAG: hypothetical protein QOK08_605 [Actinomycetota bacterium]|nr:hypothetical protein [Actinomycetota bacterium]